MNRIPKKNENAFKQMIWIPLVRVWMFGAAVLSYLRDNSFVRISMSTIFFVISFMISATGYRFGKVYLFLLIFSIPAAVVLTMISMLCRFGVEGTRAEIKSIYDDFHSRMWNYENISGSEGNRYQHLVIENEPDNIAYRIAGYLASLGGGIDTDCINSLNSIISSDNPNKQALYRKCFYEGVSSRYNFENDISMFKMKAADMYDEKIKLLDMLVALSYVDGNISVEKFKFIREVSSKIEINNKVLNRILSTRTNGQYGVHYDMDEMTREEQERFEYDVRYGTVEIFALTLMGYVASADHEVSSDEHECFIGMMEKMDARYKEEYTKRFYRGTSRKYNPRQDISLFRQKYGDDLMKYRKLLTLVIKMAYADGDVSEAEYARILAIASLLDIQEQAVQAILFEVSGGKFGKKAPPVESAKLKSSEFYRDNTLRS